MQVARGGERSWRRRSGLAGTSLCFSAVSTLVFEISLIVVVHAQISSNQDCSTAPNADSRNVCTQLRRIDQTARQTQQRPQVAQPGASPPGSPVWQQPTPVTPNTRGQAAYHPYECMTLQCLCPFFGGTMRSDTNCYLASGQPLTMGYRKEYRVLNDDERQRYHYAVTRLKQTGEYDRISAEHLSVGLGSGAHSGPGFLPWHREYVKRFEIAIRLIDPSLAIPYWDSVMDGYLPDPRDSIMFTRDFIGETDFNGFVITGPFAFWRTLEGRPYILRNLGREGQLFTEAQLNNVLQQSGVEYVLAYTVPLAGCPFPLNFNALEYTHSNIHLWIGGDMKPPETASNDPIFFLHHSFVDLIWEVWRQTRQPRWIREYSYSPNLAQCANPQHFDYANMRPFPNLANRDGLSNAYTDQLYRYAPRPTCSMQNRDCGSKYLFCDPRIYPHCVSKIRLGGLCAGFEGLDACYLGTCYFGRCAPFASNTMFSAQRPQFARAAAAPIRHFSNASMVVLDSANIFVDCFNHHSCCEKWAAEGECRANSGYTKEHCRPACSLCEPAFNATNECADRHVSCGLWSKMDECDGKAATFMRENCRSSCKICGEAKSNKCPVKGQRHRPQTT